MTISQRHTSITQDTLYTYSEPCHIPHKDTWLIKKKWPDTAHMPYIFKVLLPEMSFHVKVAFSSWVGVKIIKKKIRKKVLFLVYCFSEDLAVNGWYYYNISLSAVDKISVIDTIMVQSFLVSFKERGNYHLQAYLSFMQHKCSGIVRSLTVAILCEHDTKISFEDFESV